MEQFDSVCSHPFGGMPADLTDYLFSLLPSGADVSYFGATCKPLYFVVARSLVWKEKLRANFPSAFARLKQLDGHSKSTMWYLEYLKAQISRLLLMRDRKSCGSTKLVQLTLDVSAERSPIPLVSLIAESGKKLVVQVDRYLFLLDLISGKPIHALSFATKVRNCQQVRTKVCFRFLPLRLTSERRHWCQGFRGRIASCSDYADS